MLQTIHRLLVRVSVADTPWRSVVNKQALFIVLLLVVAGVFGRAEDAVTDVGAFNVGVAIAVAATIVAVATPWARVPVRWSILIPVLDIVAVGFLRFSVSTPLIGVALLLILPSVWLVITERGRGILLSTVMALAVVGVPVLIVEDDDVQAVDAIRVLLLPLAVAQIGWFISGLLMTVEQAEKRTREETDAKLALHATALRQARLLQNVIDSVDVGIVVVDRHGDVVFRNHFQRQILDFVSPPGIDDPDESELLEFLPDTAIPVPPERRPIRRAIMAETYSNYLVVMGPPDGEQRIVSTSARQITDSHGERDGAVISFTDVTFHMKSVQSQTKFMSMVSHELRTPLTSIVGYLDLARDQELPAPAAAHLDIVNRNAEQLLALVEDLLLTQKVANERLSFRLRPTRLCDLVRQACDSAETQAAAKGVTLERRLDPTPVADLDFTRLSQVVDNLLSNAVKFTPRGGTISVRTEVTASSMDVVVSDTGIGMSPEEQSHLYTRFYRADGATARNIPGVGLGLAIARDIVHGHGGQISLSSLPQVGSTFRVSLPLPGHDQADSGRRPTPTGRD